MSDMEEYIKHTWKVIEALKKIENISKDVLIHEIQIPQRAQAQNFVRLQDHQQHMRQIFDMIAEHLSIHMKEFDVANAFWLKEDPSKAFIFNNLRQNIDKKSLNDLLASYEFKVLSATSMSDSIIVKTTAYGQKCVLKLTADSPLNNNSLQVERDIYELVKNKLSKLSPHFLAGIDIGESGDGAIINMRSSAKQNERSLYERWILLRMNAIFADFPADGYAWNAFKRSAPPLAQQSNHNFAEYLLLEPSMQSKHRTVHYVLTKEMPGVPLGEFLKQRNLPNNILEIIMIQLAQALSVLASKRIMHNDLHFGNIFVETFDQVQTIQYIFPRKLNFHTKFVVTIFDFDRGATPNIRNKGLDNIYCPLVGQCSDYQPKFDWYTVLSHLISNAIENHMPSDQIRPFIQILGSLYEPRKQTPSIGSNAFFALPCKCTNVSSDGQRCESCERSQLQSLISPEDYFLQHVQQASSSVRMHS